MAYGLDFDNEAYLRRLF